MFFFTWETRRAFERDPYRSALRMTKGGLGQPIKISSFSGAEGIYHSGTSSVLFISEEFNFVAFL